MFWRGHDFNMRYLNSAPAERFWKCGGGLIWSGLWQCASGMPRSLNGWGPGARVQRPGGGPGGSAPWSSWVWVFSRCREKLFLGMFSVKIGLEKQKFTYKNVSLTSCMIFIDRTHSKNSNGGQHYTTWKQLYAVA